MTNKLILSSLLLLPLSFSYANQHMNKRGTTSQSTTETHSHAHSTTMNHDAHYLDAFSAHHQDGIAMARLAEERAQDPELKKLAAKMVKEQLQEVDQMKRWRDQYFPNVQSEEERPVKIDLSKLENTKGKEFDSQFAKMMIQHHEEGIKLTKNVSPTLQNEKIKNFAEKSVSKQNDEIKLLNDLSKKIDRRS